MEAEHWCMRNVDYKEINFFPQPLLSKSSQAASLTKSVASKEGKSAVNVGTKPHSSQAFGVGYGGRLQTKEKAACCRLRDAILDKRKNTQIAQIVARWPSPTLRLCDVISAEVCQAALGNLDILWTHIFHALLVMTSECQMTKLDLSQFIPTKGLLYTMLQLVPFLTLTADNLEKQTLFDMVVAKIDTEDEGLLTNLEIFLDKVLKHPVFHTRRNLRLPRGHLDIVLDCVPISADKLPFLCLLTAVAIEPISRVHFNINSIIFTYKEPGAEFVPIDPLLPLHLLKKVLKVWTLDGLSMLDIPGGRSGEVLDHRSLQQFSGLGKLSVADCGLDLTNEAGAAELCTVLGRLKHLSRLDLSTSDLSESLGALLDAVQHPLEYLSLSCCRLQVGDLDALAKSRHSTTLKDLDLAYVYADSCEMINPRAAAAAAAAPDSSKAHPTGDAGLHDDGSSTASVSTLSRADTGIDPSMPVECTHTRRDRSLFPALVHHLRSFVGLVKLDISSHVFGFKLSRDLLLDLLDSLLQVPKLKQLTMQDVPLWDDCILLLIEHVMQLVEPQCISVARSLDAPFLNMHGKMKFWKKVHRLKQGRRLRLVIANFSADRMLTSVPDSEDDVWSEYSSTGTCSEACSPREANSPRSPRS